jgi:hypothetical protein
MNIIAFNTTPTDDIIDVLTDLLPEAKEIDIKEVRINNTATHDVKVDLIIAIDGTKHHFSDYTGKLSEFDNQESKDTVLIVLEIFGEKIKNI